MTLFNIAKACEVVMHHDVELMLVEEGVNRKKSSDIENHRERKQ